MISEKIDLANIDGVFECFRKNYPRDPTTHRVYRLRVMKFLRFIEEKGITLADISEDIIGAYYEYIKADLSPKIQGIYMNTLKIWLGFLTDAGALKKNYVEAFLSSLSKTDLLTDNYLRSISKTRITNKDKLTDEEIELVMEAARRGRAKYMPLAIDVAVSTGIRVDGIGKLTLDKIRFDEVHKLHYIQLTKGLVWEESDTKSHSYRVPVEEALVDRIKAFVEKRNNNKKQKVKPEFEHHLFVSNTGNAMEGNTISMQFTIIIRRVIDRKEIDSRKLSFHSLRKSFGTRMLQKGFKIHEVSKMLGHSDVLVTMRYLRIDQSQIFDAYAEKRQEQSLDLFDDLNAIKENKAQQREESEIVKQQQELDRELEKLLSMFVSGTNNQTLVQIRIGEIIAAREQLRSQILTPREQKLVQELEFYKNRANQLQQELLAREKMQELTNYKFYERKAKKSIKQQMHDRAAELRGQELGYGKIADMINEEFSTTFSRGTIKYWLQTAAK